MKLFIVNVLYLKIVLFLKMNKTYKNKIEEINSVKDTIKKEI